MKIAGLDIGTTGCKLTVFTEEGQYLDKAYRDYPVSRSRKKHITQEASEVAAEQLPEEAVYHEIDTQTILEAVFAVMKEIGTKYAERPSCWQMKTELRCTRPCFTRIPEEKQSVGNWKPKWAAERLRPSPE